MKKMLTTILVSGSLVFAVCAFAAGKGNEKTLAKKGEDVFATKGCTACHTIGKGKLVGPDLKGVAKTMGPDWIRHWLKNTTGMLKTDKHALELEKQYGIPMPQQSLTDEEINSLIDYFNANN